MFAGTEFAKQMSSKQTRPELKSCGVLLFREQPRLSFLLMEHTDRWDLPKGHVDPGETELETALRELHEETGIAHDQIELDPDFRFSSFYTVRKKRFGKKPMLKELVIFLGTLTSHDLDQELEITEHIGYDWFDWDPPHEIQLKSIDPLLHAVDEYWGREPVLRTG